MITKITRSILFVALVTALFNSCSVLEDDIPSASYIHIDSIMLNTDYASQGSKSCRITDAWVFYDSEFLGTFPLPSTIPLIGVGSHKLIIRPGIIQNGLSNSRASYPKYTSLDTTVDLKVNQTLKLNPTVTYGSAVHFPQREDFDMASLTLESTNPNYAPLNITPAADPNAFEGSSGFSTLDANHPTFEIASSTAYSLPGSTPVYIEFDFKSDVDISVGVLISTNVGIVKSPLVSFSTTSKWKKEYVTVNELGGIQSNAIDYKIYFRAEYSGSSSANVFLDNIKVVY